MQISSRFTMAIHMFACIDTFSDQKMTSDFMAKNIHHFLYNILLEVHKAMEEKLSEMTLADVKKDIAVYTEEE